MFVRVKEASALQGVKGASNPFWSCVGENGAGGLFLVIRESEGGKQSPWSVVSEGRVTHQVVGESEGEVTTKLVWETGLEGSMMCKENGNKRPLPTECDMMVGVTVVGTRLGELK